MEELQIKVMLMDDIAKNKTSEITYFSKPGRHNTEIALQLARRRAEELNLRYILLASTTGRTAIRAAEIFEGLDAELIVVSEHYGFKDEGRWLMKQENLQELEKRDIRIVIQSHMLSGVERSFTQELGGSSRVEAVAQAIRGLVGVGVKVCIEIAIMAADGGHIPCGPHIEVMAIAGYGGGADTAVIIRPAHMNNFFDLEVREYVCLPRYHRPTYKLDAGVE